MPSLRSSRVGFGVQFLLLFFSIRRRCQLATFVTTQFTEKAGLGLTLVISVGFGGLG